MIGYYAHHLGVGHVNRAAAIAAELTAPVVGFSTRAAPASWKDKWVLLPDDSPLSDTANSDVTAGGALHWVPLGHIGLRERMGLIGNELARGAIRLMVVDVSVEVAVLARLYGVPTVVMAQPGDRSDRPHRMAYDLAEKLLAPWPPSAPEDWPQRWLDKTVHLGALSRFDRFATRAADSDRRVLVLWGQGGLDVAPEDVGAAAAATPDWRWDVLGPPVQNGRQPTNVNWRGWVDDVWTELAAATVVVTHAGQNALAEVAAARRPAVVVPQDRPHGEQLATAASLRDLGIGVVESTWPSATRWPSVLERAMKEDSHNWAGWSMGDGASRAAQVLESLVTNPRNHRCGFA